MSEPMAVYDGWCSPSETVVIGEGERWVPVTNTRNEFTIQINDVSPAMADLLTGGAVSDFLADRTGPERRAYHVEALGNYNEPDGDRDEVATGDANLIGSLIRNRETHMPVLDLDIPHRLVPSSTPGHSHLYIDVECTWEQYRRMLEAMRDAGVIQAGYCGLAIERGQTYVRAPGVTKEDLP